MKKANSINSRINELKKDIKGKVTNEIQERYNEALKDGKYPWEGAWLTTEEIRSAQSRLKKRDRIVFTELMVLFIILAFFAMIFYQVTINFMPNSNEIELKNTKNTGMTEFSQVVDEKNPL